MKAGFKDSPLGPIPVGWEVKRLGEIADKRSQKNSDFSAKEIFTNSATEGVISQRDYFNKDIGQIEKSQNYGVIHKDDFVYNPRISVSAPVGPINRNHLGTGAMSPLYTIFRFKQGNLNFLEMFFQTNLWHGYMNSIANFGARHDRMNITSAGFLKLPIALPPLAEQEKIAEILTTVDDKIGILQDKRAAYQELKKGLMQSLLTRGIGL